MPRNKGSQKKWASLDNKTYLEKSRLRKQMLSKLDDMPVILETHGGKGDLFRRCYADVETGLVFETDPAKAEKLVYQRPNWAVYETDCVWGLENGVGSHLKVNFVDADPYGQAWHVLEAFFNSQRPRAEQVIVVVHDGVRASLQRFGSLNMDIFAPIVEQIGELNLHRKYLDVCEQLLDDVVSTAGYVVAGFGGFYSKRDKNQTHFFADAIFYTSTQKNFCGLYIATAASTHAATRRSSMSMFDFGVYIFESIFERVPVTEFRNGAVEGRGRVSALSILIFLGHHSSERVSFRFTGQRIFANTLAACLAPRVSIAR